MALAAAALGIFAVLRLHARTRLAFLLAAAAMASAYAGYQHWVFGTLSPLARYAGTMPPAMARATPLRTLVGLFVDGAYGLLPYAPVVLLALAGLPLVFGRGRRDRWALALLGLGVLLPVLGWRNWFGFSPPARVTVPLVPLLALAAALRAAAGRGLARWSWGLVAAVVALAAWMFAEPRAMRMVGSRSSRASTWAPPAAATRSERGYHAKSSSNGPISSKGRANLRAVSPLRGMSSALDGSMVAS